MPDEQHVQRRLQDHHQQRPIGDDLDRGQDRDRGGDKDGAGDQHRHGDAAIRSGSDRHADRDQERSIRGVQGHHHLPDKHQ